jgi:hypothetical protein
MARSMSSDDRTTTRRQDAPTTPDQATPAKAPPRRRTVASFDSYEDAQRAVDRLSDQGFPVERVAIVGHGMRYVEQVMGRLTTGRAALLGASQGAAIGAIFGLLLGLIFTIRPNPALILLVIYGIVAGAILGAIAGALAHAATGGERDFTSVPAMVAERYELQVDDDVADRAAEALQQTQSGRFERTP